MKEIEPTQGKEESKHTPREIIEQAILKWLVSLEYAESMLGSEDDENNRIDCVKDKQELAQYIEAGYIILEDFDREGIK